MILRIYHKSIKAKLASAVAVPLVVAVALAGFALFKFNMLSHAFHDVVEKDVPVAQDALHAEVELYGLSRAEAWLALSSNPEQLTRAEAAYEYERKAVDKIIAQLNERADPAALTKLEAFEKGWQAHIVLSGRLKEMLNAGNNEEARAFAMGPLADSVNGLKEQLEALSEYKQEEMAASMSDVDASFQSATMMMIGAVVVGAAIAVFLGIVIARGILGAIIPVINRAQRIAEQDLSGEELPIKTQDEVGTLTSAINEMWASLRTIVSDVRSSSSEVAAAATEVAASSEEMASGTERQSRSVSEVASALEEMSASITEVADKSTNAARDADDAGKLAQSGGEIVQKSIQGMNEIDATVTASATAVEELGKQSEQIGEVIEVINEIAEQTNLLALNAAIEAARAGEHGRGFAVVADEVRKLADRTTKATMEIAESITAMQSGTAQAVERMRKGTEEVKVGVDRANEAGDSLSSIVASSQGVGALVRSIAAAAEQQSAASTQISRSVQEISSVSRETSEAVSQSAQAASELSQKAERLQELVSGFKI